MVLYFVISHPDRVLTNDRCIMHYGMDAFRVVPIAAVALGNTLIAPMWSQN